MSDASMVRLLLIGLFLFFAPIELIILIVLVIGFVSLVWFALS